MKILLSSLVMILSFYTYAVDNNIADEEESSVLIEENNFQELSKKMKANSLGLVLMFHAEHCPYCAIMEKEILSPMVKSGEYDKKVYLRKLQIDEARDVIDFSGKTVEPSDISSRFSVNVTPTLVFLDYKGKEQAQKMIGINTVELFGAYLDDEIDKLVKNIGISNKKGE